ncbi:MAG: glycerate kinase [Phycisphaerales bacterium]
MRSSREPPPRTAPADRPAPPRRVLVAPDKFKGTMSAQTAAEALARAIAGTALDGAPVEIDLAPIADGGEGSLEVLAGPLHLERRVARVHGPLGEAVDAEWGLDPSSGLAVVELSQAAGLWRAPPDRRNPTATTTVGAGELIAIARDAGAVRVLVALGGSATCDAGLGLAVQLGVRFLDAAGRTLAAPLAADDGPQGALRLAPRELGPRVVSVEAPRLPFAIEALCDVGNPLVGPRGAAMAFAPQKGATPDDVEFLERMLAGLARCLVDGRDVAPLASARGAGAAGGVGFGLAAWCDAALRDGAATIFELLDLPRRVRSADLIVTGEGRLDATSFEGKAVGRLAALAAAPGAVKTDARGARPVVAIVGSIDPQLARAARAALVGPGRPFAQLVSIEESVGPELAFRDPPAALEATVRRALTHPYPSLPRNPIPDD